MEVDRVNELTAKLRRYTDWFELLAPKTDPIAEKAGRAVRQQGAAVHDCWLWSRIYPVTGRGGHVPVAFVFTGKTAAQRESRTRRLERSTRRYFAGTPYPWVQFPAAHYHRAVPVVVTELEGIARRPVCGREQDVAAAARS